MVQQQKITRDKKKVPVVISEKSLPLEDPKYANTPVRTVHFVEVGDMTQSQLRVLLSELGRVHDTAKGGIHYVLPVRKGKIGADIVFEEEFEKIGKVLFEVVGSKGNIITDATIRLKGGAQDVLVVREHII
jgi:hypothetical protein